LSPWTTAADAVALAPAAAGGGAVSRRRVASVALVILAAAGSGCGIPHDERPIITPGGVVGPALAPNDTPGPPAATAREAPVFLVQAEHLVQAVRKAPRHELSVVLSHLLAGPTPSEFGAGVRTAISPQTTLRSANVDGATAVVDLSSACVEVGGQEQILAVAQIVLTATAVPGVTQVRFLLKSQAVEVPRADGTLTSDTLRAEDYAKLLTEAP
jgi:hypothetical protein